MIVPRSANHVVIQEGVCRVCGCTDANPCVIEDDEGNVSPCCWIDLDHSLCSNFRCWASVPLDELLRMRLFTSVQALLRRAWEQFMGR
jgi:hypothetical protein